MTRLVVDDRRAGFSLTEVLVSMVITLLVMGGVFSIMVQNQSLYEMEARSADLQQTLRIAQNLMVRQLRVAGRDPSGYAFDQAHQINDCLSSTAAVSYIDAIQVAGNTQIRIRADLPFDENSDNLLTTTLETGSSPTDGTDETGDSCINDPGEDVEFTFECAGGAPPPCPPDRLGTLSRTSRGPIGDVTQPIADGLTNVTFQYRLIDDPNTLVPSVTQPDFANVNRILITLEAMSDKKDPVSRTYLTYKLASDVELRNSPPGQRIPR